MKLFKRILAFFVSLMIIFSSVFSALAAEEKQSSSDFLEVVGAYIRDFGQSLQRIFSINYDFVKTEKYTENSFDVPGLSEGFIPQGMCFSDSIGCFVISGYMDNGDFSRIYLIRESDEKVGLIELKDYTGHAGGTASFENDIYICSGGSEKSGGYIYRLRADKLAKVFDEESGKIQVELSEKFRTDVRASFMCIGDGMLWVGEFYNRDNKTNKAHYKGKNRAWAVGYELPVSDFFGGEKAIPDVLLSIPDQVQGMAVTKDGEILFSTSYGRHNDSVMYVFDNYKNWGSDTVTVSSNEVPIYISAKENRITRFKMPTLMEGIEYKGDSLYIIFESGANKYSNAKKVIKNIYKMDINSIIERF